MLILEGKTRYLLSVNFQILGRRKVFNVIVILHALLWPAVWLLTVLPFAAPVIKYSCFLVYSVAWTVHTEMTTEDYIQTTTSELTDDVIWTQEQECNWM